MLKGESWDSLIKPAFQELYVLSNTRQVFHLERALFDAGLPVLGKSFEGIKSIYGVPSARRDEIDSRSAVYAKFAIKTCARRGRVQCRLEQTEFVAERL